MSDTALFFNLTPTPRELVFTAVQWQQQGKAIAFATLVNIEGNAPYPVGSQMLINQSGDFLGHITGGCAEQAIAGQAVASINSQRNTQQRYGLNSPYFDIKLPCGSGIDVHFDAQISKHELQPINDALQSRSAVQHQFGLFTKQFQPNPRLVLFGQGPIMVKLAQLALQTGFDVCCVAQNNDTANLLNSAGLKHHLITQAALLFDTELDEFTAFISLFHEHELEVSLLQTAVQSNSFYIGALGSRKTHKARLQDLAQRGIEPDALKRIHGPVGLNIGANTPAQIALSILADVTAHMNSVIE